MRQRIKAGHCYTKNYTIKGAAVCRQEVGSKVVNFTAGDSHYEILKAGHAERMEEIKAMGIEPVAKVQQAYTICFGKKIDLPLWKVQSLKASGITIYYEQCLIVQ